MIANSSGNALRFPKPAFFILSGFLLCTALSATAQTVQQQTAPVQVQTVQTESGARKVKSNPPPEYPELARRLNIQGTARVLLTIATDGKVSNVKDLGGSPILLAALSDAVKKWKYEPADRESQIEVRFEFVQNR